MRISGLPPGTPSVILPLEGDAGTDDSDERVIPVFSFGDRDFYGTLVSSRPQPAADSDGGDIIARDAE